MSCRYFHSFQITLSSFPPAISTCWLHKQNSYQSSRELSRTYQQSAGVITKFFLLKQQNPQKLIQTIVMTSELFNYSYKVMWPYIYIYHYIFFRDSITESSLFSPDSTCKYIPKEPNQDDSTEGHTAAKSSRKLMSSFQITLSSFPPAISTCWLHKQNSYQSSRELSRTYQQSAGVITKFF
jgi:hypothetical protein